jgi:hypothetical protein
MVPPSEFGNISFATNWPASTFAIAVGAEACASAGLIVITGVLPVDMVFAGDPESAAIPLKIHAPYIVFVPIAATFIVTPLKVIAIVLLDMAFIARASVFVAVGRSAVSVLPATTLPFDIENNQFPVYGPTPPLIIVLNENDAAPTSIELAPMLLGAAVRPAANDTCRESNIIMAGKNAMGLLIITHL